MMVPGLTIEKRDDGVLVIAFDRPERRNAFDEEMAAELLRLFSEEGRAPTIRVMVLKGAGPHFCAGFDLKARPKLSADDGIMMVARMYQALVDVPVLTLALVDGVAYGGAIGFLAACDMVVATRSARFACPEGRHGMLPGVMTAFLTRAIGARNALSMIATASPISADRACAFGLVSEVVEDQAALLARQEEVIHDILMTGPVMARQAKALVRLAAGPPIAPAVVAEAVALASASRQGAEAREGFKAFRERRPPSWTGGS